MRKCEWCGKSIVGKNGQARFCTSAHRVYAHRAAKNAPPYPAELISRNRWVRWAPVIRKGKTTKVPLAAAGDYASSTNPDTWSSFAMAAESTVGVGLGYVLGDGIGCIDLDHCINNGVLDDEAEYFIANYPGNYIEISPSGDGLHIWGIAAEAPGTKRSFNGLSIERYSVDRYITITGNIYQHGDLLPL